jgi:hypothetical protein
MPNAFKEWINVHPLLALLATQVPLVVTLVGLWIRWRQLRLVVKKEQRDERKELIDDLREGRAVYKDLWQAAKESHAEELERLQRWYEEEGKLHQARRAADQEEMERLAGESTKIVVQTSVLVLNVMAGQFTASRYAYLKSAESTLGNQRLLVLFVLSLNAVAKRHLVAREIVQEAMEINEQLESAISRDQAAIEAVRPAPGTDLSKQLQLPPGIDPEIEKLITRFRDYCAPKFFAVTEPVFGDEQEDPKAES